MAKRKPHPDTTAPHDTHDQTGPEAPPAVSPVHDHLPPSPEPLPALAGHDAGHAHPADANGEPHAHAGLQKKPTPDPFGIATDYAAGVRLLESRKYRQVQIAFEDKPGQAVIDAVKAAGFKWNGPDRVWTKQLGQQPAQVRVDAERVFEEACRLIREEKGISRQV